MKKQIDFRIVSLVFSVLVVCFAIVFYAVAQWTEPSVGPPGGNVPAPLNTGLIDQVKEGALGIYGVFRAVGGADPAIEPGLVVNNGDVGIGTTTPSEALDLASGNLITTGRGTFGQLYVANYIRRYQDSNTYILFNPDEIHFVAGGSSFLTLHEGAVDYIEVWHDLDVSGDIVASGTICDSGGANCIGSGGGGIPSGAVMFFNLVACPSEWSELAGAQGRYIVGLPSGGVLGGTQGTALSNLENRPTGGHYHYGAQGVRGIGARVDRIFPQGGAGSSSSTVSNKGSDGGPSLPALIDTVAGTNAPYIQLLTCQKD